MSCNIRLSGSSEQIQQTIKDFVDNLPAEKKLGKYVVTVLNDSKKHTWFKIEGNDGDKDRIEAVSTLFYEHGKTLKPTDVKIEITPPPAKPVVPVVPVTKAVVASNQNAWVKTAVAVALIAAVVVLATR